MYSFLLGSQAFQAWFPSLKIRSILLITNVFCDIFQDFTPVWRIIFRPLRTKTNQNRFCNIYSSNQNTFLRK